MLDVLKLVMGAVATKDMVPILTHFCVYRDLLNLTGRIQGSNGVVYVDAAFDHNITDCSVPAQRFLKAVSACDGMPTFGLTEGGKLSIKHGRFKAYLPILSVEDFPRAMLDGERFDLAPGFVSAISRLQPFISDDASRPWSLSVLLSKDFAYATNNVILARTPIVWTSADLALPLDLVEQLLEIGTDPDAIYIGPSHVGFSYGDTWIRSAVMVLVWPDVARFISKVPADEHVPDELVSAVTRIKDFCVNDKFPIINFGTQVSTDNGEYGASFEGFDLPEARFHADQLMKVLSLATHINFSSYPKPCAWRGDGLEGMISGLRMA